MRLKIIRSFRRQKTASAQLKNGILEVRLPAWISEKESQKIIKNFIARVKRKHSIITNNKQLKKLADQLNNQYFEGKLKYKIYWSKNQNSLEGSCSYKKGVVRISYRLKTLPKWVLKAVIVHELTHLLVPNHSQKFWEIANRYPLMERARGYLLAWEKFGEEKIKKLPK
ncbi:MAG: M48 family metallopeptidase [Microgenomates group bacterium]